MRILNLFKSGQDVLLFGIFSPTSCCQTGSWSKLLGCFFSLNKYHLKAASFIDSVYCLMLNFVWRSKAKPEEENTFYQCCIYLLRQWSSTKSRHLKDVMVHSLVLQFAGVFSMAIHEPGHVWWSPTELTRCCKPNDMDCSFQKGLSKQIQPCAKVWIQSLTLEWNNTINSPSLYWSPYLTGACCFSKDGGRVLD